MIDDAVDTEIVSKEDLADLRPNISNKQALINMSKDPAGLQVFLDKSKAGKLKYTLDIVKCIDLYMKGVSVTDIAKIHNLNGYNRKVRKYIARAIQRYKPDIDMTEIAVYKEHRTAYLIQKQKSILEGITPEKIEAATLKDLAVANDKLFQNERLNENKATANIAHQFASIVEQVHKDRDLENE